MEELIRQAFLHVDVLGPHVQEGHYDLIGPNGELILPQVWETTVEPGWEISMHMWPMPEGSLATSPSPGHQFDPQHPASGRDGRRRGAGLPPHPPLPGWPPGASAPPSLGVGPLGDAEDSPEAQPLVVMPNVGSSRPSGSIDQKPRPSEVFLYRIAGSKPKSSGKRYFPSLARFGDAG